MRKTKIICTIGPSSENIETLTKMCQEGMNVARLNFSHGSHEEHQNKINLVKEAREKLNMPIALMLDTKGPEYRIKTFENGKIELKDGDFFTFTTEDVVGNETIVSVNYKQLMQNLEVGDTILVNNGLVIFKIVEIDDKKARCIVVSGGELSNRKSMNFPNRVMAQDFLSEQDRSDLLFGIENQVDFVAASFVSRKKDVADMRRFLDENGGADIDIIAKIENREGVNNIDSILAAADAVMVARGDLGVEIDFTELPGIQKTIIDRSFSFGKPIVTATQMLDSMMVNPRPTRAEISDVANAIYDGTSAIMLSGETAAGAYPVDALKTMSAIAERTEQENHARFVPLTENTGKISVSDATAHAACLTAKDVNAAAIVTVSESGNTARLLSKYRPEQPIIACVMKEQVQRQLALSWGITPLMMPLAHSTDELIEMSTSLAKENGYLHNGELAVVTAGVPVGVSGTTNMIKIHMVGNCLATGVGVGPENNDVASGKACVCRTMDEVRAKFKPGMVLVVPSTSNEMLSFVRDAAALVVEEPGLNSHAAIAGKALLKPTVVGAAGATSHIRDGLMVAVDCAHGSVQRLQA